MLATCADWRQAVFVDLLMRSLRLASNGPHGCPCEYETWIPEPAGTCSLNPEPSLVIS